MARNNAGLCLARGDDSGTVRTDEPHAPAFHEGHHLEHVQRRDALGDADRQRDLRIGSFHDRVGRKWGRNENHRRVRSGLPTSIMHAVKDRPTLVGRATFAWRDASDNARAVRRRRLRVEGSFASGQALDDEPGVPVEEDCHDYRRASATTFSAASPIESAVVKFKLLSRMICLPSSTLVPSIRITIGTGTPSSVTAATTPCASTSQRRIPPKMLMSTALTFLSAIRIRKAFLICSAFAPPPTSRKFAGSPPASLMMSIVAIARPAPFTMQPIFPSSRM